jgi:hypothetical protein
MLMPVSEAEGREASPSAGIIDSLSAKTTEAGGPRGYAAEEMVKGRKRRVSQTHRLSKEVWCCTRDERKPLEVGSQVQASNRCTLLSSKVTVVSVAEKPGLDFGRHRRRGARAWDRPDRGAPGRESTGPPRSDNIARMSTPPSTRIAPKIIVLYQPAMRLTRRGIPGCCHF